MSSSTDRRPPSPGTSFALRFLLAGVVVLLVAGAVVAATIQHEAQTLVAALPDETKASKEAQGVLDDVEPGKPQTMLLVGDDARIGEESGQRSDTMILVRLDEDAKVTSMLSLPRDLIVAGGNGARLNASNVGKGPAGLIVQLQRILSTPQERFQVNHYASIRFSAFSAAVKAFGCFYADVDRKYFNDNNPPVGGKEPYAAIDVKAGYQRLCGEDSLAYVRFRHLDNDVVREARQAHYLAEARAQVATSKLITNGTSLAKTILGFVDTDIRTSKGLLGVVKLALGVVGKPTKRVTLTTTDTKEGALSTTPADLAKAARQFLHPGSPPKTKASQNEDKPSRSTGGAKKAKKKTPKIPATLTANASAAADNVRNSGIAQNFTGAPIYIPKLVQNGAVYKDNDSRGYDIASAGGRAFPWQGYRLVVAVDGARGGIGQYYGIQGTTWKDPPVLDLTTDEVTLAGRKFRIEYDGTRIRRLVWKTPNGTYWINNSLKNSLTNNEMRAIARSLMPFQGGGTR